MISSLFTTWNKTYRRFALLLFFSREIFSAIFVDQLFHFSLVFTREKCWLMILCCVQSSWRPSEAFSSLSYHGAVLAFLLLSDATFKSFARMQRRSVAAPPSAGLVWNNWSARCSSMEAQPSFPVRQQSQKLMHQFTAYSVWPSVDVVIKTRLLPCNKAMQRWSKRIQRYNLLLTRFSIVERQGSPSKQMRQTAGKLQNTTTLNDAAPAESFWP